MKALSIFAICLVSASTSFAGGNDTNTTIIDVPVNEAAMARAPMDLPIMRLTPSQHPRCNEMVKRASGLLQTSNYEVNNATDVAKMVVRSLTLAPLREVLRAARVQRDFVRMKCGTQQGFVDQVNASIAAQQIGKSKTLSRFEKSRDFEAAIRLEASYAARGANGLSAISVAGESKAKGSGASN